MLTMDVTTGVLLPPSLVLPRFGTPRNYDRATFGPEVGEVARRLGKPLMPWQQYAIDVALEVDPDTGELWYEEVVITVPRQSGKTTLILAVLVWRCIVVARRLQSQTCTYLAQSGKMARRKLEREFARIMRASRSLHEIPPSSRERPTRDNEWKLSMNNGSENIYFGTRSYLQIEAPTGTGSHGDVLDMSVIDEAFAHEDDLVEQAVDAATVTRRSPQSYVVSTAGNEKSVFLARKVLAGRRSCADEIGSRSCYMEWSVPDELAYDDPEVWAQYLPALGHTITTRRLLARLEKALRNPDEVDEEGYEPGLAGFRRAYLNQWPKWPDLGGQNRDRVVPVGAWADSFNPKSTLDGSRVAFAVDVSPDNDHASIAYVGRNPDGRLHGEILESQPGVRWVVPRLVTAIVNAGGQFAAFGYDPGSTSAAIVPDLLTALQAAGVPLEAGKESKVIKVAGQTYAAACSALLTAVIEDEFAHRNQPWLNTAVDGAKKRPLGQAWAWDRKNWHTDITPLCAVTVAMRAFQTAPEPQRPARMAQIVSF